jgi:hypothetical protein
VGVLCDERACRGIGRADDAEMLTMIRQEAGATLRVAPAFFYLNMPGASAAFCCVMGG